MQSDNDYSTTLAEGNLAAAEDPQEKTLQWLLDQDYADSSEKLFTVSEEEHVECGLTEYETEVANRPMFGGEATMDDLASMVDEEIVMMAPGQGGNIFSSSAPAKPESAIKDDTNITRMALDHSQATGSHSHMVDDGVEEGFDILGLAEEDDMGERFLVIQKPQLETSSDTEPLPVPATAAANESATPSPVFPELVVVRNEPTAEVANPVMEATDAQSFETGIEYYTESTSTDEDSVEQSAQSILTDEIQEEQEPGLAENFDVFDYVAANEPPADEEDFDQYLLGGEHFEERDAGVDGLIVDCTEGVASVDPSVDVTIDYHEDFDAENTLVDNTVIAITPVIAEVMEELSTSVEQRLEDLCVEKESVQVEVLLGSDEQSSAACQAENYVPIREIGAGLPAALLRLGQTEIDAIYVRLSGIADDTIWNEMFREEFTPPNNLDSIFGELIDDNSGLDGGDTITGEAFEFDVELDLSSGNQGFDGTAQISADELADDLVFDEDIFGEDIGEDPTAFIQSADTDLDPPSLSLALEESLAKETESVSPEIVFEADIFGEGIDDEFADFAEVFEANQDTLLDNPEPEALELESLDDAQISSVFDDDIFSTDLDEEFASEQNADGVDVEALINSLADVESDIGDICGIDADEFSDDETPESVLVEAEVVDEELKPELALVAAVLDNSWCVPADIKFSYTGTGASEVFTDFLDAFIEEGASELEKLEDALGEWEKDLSCERAYAPIPRVLHTLKGIAKSVGLQRYGTLIHNFESLLEALARPAAGQEQAYFLIINAWLDAAVRGFEHIEQSRSDVASELPANSKAPVANPVAAVSETETSQANDQTTTIPQSLTALEEKRKEKQLADEGAKVLAAQQTIRMTPQALDRLLSLTNEAQQLGVRSSQSTVRSKRSAAELLGRLSSVRAHVSKIADRALLNVAAKSGEANSALDALEMDQYSELQEAANILREGVEDLDDLIHVATRQTSIAEALLKQQASIISSLGSSIQAARVVPVSRLMPGLRRIVRNVSADLGKSVSFQVINEVGTLDRDNHARCQTILEHMTRNALDHGIETPDIRVAAGKSATGTITIDASKQGADYIVSLSDDGKGIDPEFMRDSAYEKGLDIDVDALSDDEAVRLIFHKGFSTANSLSEISGRGVGMDIVLSELQQIGGDIEIKSVVGEGTTFRVRIPSNVTVNGALLVTAGEVSYAIPLDGLIAVEHVPVADFYDAINSASQLSLFGMDCVPAYLATLCEGASLPDLSAWSATVPVIIAGTKDRYMAIAIDDVQQALELVIRSLGAQFSNIPGLAGGATTADGQSVVALDLNALVESVAAEVISPVSVHKEREERLLVLVVDDSRTQRMVATSQFDTLGVETVTAENGLVAIDLLNTTHRLPDVVLLDIEMPVKDGIQTLREIRKSARYSDLPVIMVTSRTGAKHRSLAEEAGCSGYMGKPFNFPKLCEQIADLTNHKFQLS